VKIRFENLIGAVRVLTGTFAFLIWIVVGSLLFTEPLLLVLVGIIVFLWFHKMGGVFAKLLERTNYEITDIDRDKFEVDTEKKSMGRLLDVSQSAELPYGE
jgi:hypothetical protein